MEKVQDQPEQLGETMFQEKTWKQDCGYSSAGQWLPSMHKAPESASRTAKMREGSAPMKLFLQFQIAAMVIK